MKLVEHLTIGGKEQRLVKREIKLELSAAGKAIFRVQAESKPSGLVLYQCGYAKHQLHDFFIGYIEQATPEGKTWQLSCRELMHGLTQIAHVSLRQCVAADVLADVQRATKVEFVDISTNKVPRFASHSDGFAAVRNLQRVFQIPDFVFFQQKDGKVWCGEWKQAEELYTKAREIDPKFFTRHTPSSAVLPALPALRPGMLVNGRHLLAVRLSAKHETHLTWSK